MPHIIPIRDLKNTNAISQLCQESDEPIYVTKNGYGDMVIMSMKTYEQKLLRLEVEAAIEKSEEDIKAGRFTDAFDAMSEVERQYGL